MLVASCWAVWRVEQSQACTGCHARKKKVGHWAMREKGRKQAKNGPFVARLAGPNPVACYWAWVMGLGYGPVCMGLIE